MTSPAAVDTGPAHTADAYLGGRIVILQPKKGHRAGLDAALLQAVVPGDATGLAIDLGTGVGTVALSIAARVPGLRTIGVERDASLAALARAALLRPENAGFADRATFVEGDVAVPGTSLEPALAERSADWALMNPPWDSPGRMRASPDAGRRAAHVAEPDTLDLWMRAAARLLKAGGALGLVHRAQALPAILAALSGRFGDVRILPVHPSARAAATRILVRGVNGSRAPLQLLPGLVLHEPDGTWTRRADALLRGEATLAI